MNAIMFGAYGNMYRFLGQFFDPNGEAHVTGQRDTSLGRIAIAGGWAGFLQCFIMTPSELIKCKLQVCLPFVLSGLAISLTLHPSGSNWHDSAIQRSMGLRKTNRASKWFPGSLSRLR